GPLGFAGAFFVDLGVDSGAALTTGAGVCLTTSASVVAGAEPEPPLVATTTAAITAPSANAPTPKIPVRARGVSPPTLSSAGQSTRSRASQAASSTPSRVRSR